MGDEGFREIIALGAENAPEVAALGLAYKAAKGLLVRIAGPAADEIGAIVLDKVRMYRFKNQIKILSKAKVFLEEAGLTPNIIPLRTLLPLLDGAALEDDDYLSSKWAALIANAASGLDKSLSHPSFPKILSEMSPQDAVILDALLERGNEFGWTEFREEMAKKLSLDLYDINCTHNNLLRLGIARTTTKEGKSIIGLFPFGELFVRACTEPKRR
jgi:hypothetical protein